MSKKVVPLHFSCNEFTKDVIDAVDKVSKIAYNKFLLDIIGKENKKITDTDILEISTVHPDIVNTKYSNEINFSNYKKECLKELQKLDLSPRLIKVLDVSNNLYKNIILSGAEWTSQNILEKYMNAENLRAALCLTIDEFKQKCYLDEEQEYKHTQKLFKSIYNSFYKNTVFKESYGVDSKINIIKEFREENKKELKYCPYCNIEILKLKGTEIEHFIPISQNPLYGFTNYNLIISCHDCNVVYKKTTLNTPILSPYFDNIHEYIKYVYNEEEKKIEIVIINSVYESHVNNFVNMIGLLERMNNDYMDDVMNMYRIYNSMYINCESYSDKQDLLCYLDLEKAQYGQVLYDLITGNLSLIEDYSEV